MSAQRTNTGPEEILPGNLVWQSLEALKLEVPASVWNHHYDLVWSAMKLQADEIERLRADLKRCLPYVPHVFGDYDMHSPDCWVCEVEKQVWT